MLVLYDLKEHLSIRACLGHCSMWILSVCIFVALDALQTDRHSGATELCKETWIETTLLFPLLCYTMCYYNTVYFTALTTFKKLLYTLYRC